MIDFTFSNKTIFFLAKSMLLFVILVLATFLLSVSVPVYGQDELKDQACAGIAAAGGGTCPDADTAKAGINSTVKNVINLLLYAVGIAAVIMLIIGAIKYVVSGGDQAAVASAKNTIIYAIVGIVVAIMAFAIVNLVISRTTTVTRADNLEVTSRARV